MIAASGSPKGALRETGPTLQGLDQIDHGDLGGCTGKCHTAVWTPARNYDSRADQTRENLCQEGRRYPEPPGDFP